MAAYTSCYSFERDPRKYAIDRQGDYERRAEEGIARGDASIREVRTRAPGDLTLLFYELISKFASLRSAIALSHGTTDGAYFGQRRDEARFLGTCGGHHVHTPLDGEPYLTYQNGFLEKLSSLLQKPLPPTTTLGRRSIFEITVFNHRALAERKWDTPPFIEEIRRGCGVSEVPLTEVIPIGKTKDCLSHLKEHDPELYLREKVFCALDEMKKRHPTIPDEASWVIATSHLDEWELSTYFTWLSPSERQPLTRSAVIVVHQDLFLIEPMLREINELFLRCIGWDPSAEPIPGEFTELKNRVSLLSYTFSHTMPFVRGSAAIQEWLRAAIFRSHGLEMTYNRDASADLDALTALSLGDFVTVHNRNTTLARRVVA
ncbi:MAG: hypothetical protein JSR76_03495 [Verrucomicrobia bacterium]|nr:hypothetical protein [Verrucomicrobiota bacterium]